METMKALVFRGKCTVALEDVPVPTMQEPTDAIVKISLCALCGSDMHPYHCREEGLDHGTVCGHEFVGIVDQIGDQVQKLKPGDRIMSPFTTSCSDCFFCKKGLTARCEQSQLFGWVENGHGLHGAQAQYVRVPNADSTLMIAPESISNEQALLLGDVLSTGFYCAENSGIAEYNDSLEEAEQVVVAVVGCGPVGLIAVSAAKYLLRGRGTVLAVDSVPERLELASKLGAVPVDRSNIDPVEEVKDATGGRGADFCLECVGLPPAFALACDLVRPGGTVSVAGCHSEAVAPLSMVYNKNLTLKSGRCPARYYMERLLPLVEEGVEELNLGPLIITHRLGLTPEAYSMFDKRENGVIKIVMDPWQ